MSVESLRSYKELLATLNFTQHLFTLNGLDLHLNTCSDPEPSAMTHSAEHQDLKTQVHHLEAMANRKEPAKEIESKSASNEDITASTRTEAKSGINRHTILAFIVSVRTPGPKGMH